MTKCSIPTAADSEGLPVLGIGSALLYTLVFTFLRFGLVRMTAIFGIVAGLPLGLRDILGTGGRLAAAAILLNFAFRKSSSSWSQAMGLKRFNGWLLLPMIGVAAGLSILVSEAVNGLEWLHPPPVWLLRLFAPGRHLPLTRFVDALVFVPLIEEAFFRRLILGGLLRRYSAPTAILVSTALFTLWHRNPYQFVVAFAEGVTAGWIYVRCRSLWPCVILHALMNLMPELFVIGAFPWAISGYSLHASRVVLFQPGWFDVLGAELLAAGLVGLRYFFKRRPGPASQGMA